MSAPSTPTLPPDIEREIRNTAALHASANSNEAILTSGVNALLYAAIDSAFTKGATEFYTRAVKDTERRVWMETVAFMEKSYSEFLNEGKRRGYLK